MKIVPLDDNIIFQFEDEVYGGHFRTTTENGVIVRSFQQSADLPRWGKVLFIGPKVNTSDISIGSRILIEALKWTEGVTYMNQKFWKTNEKHVLGVEYGV